MSRPRRRVGAVVALVAVALGLTVVVGAVVALGRARTTPSAFGVVEPITSEPADGSGRSPGVAGTATLGRGTATPERPADGLARPSRLEVPELGVSAPVDSVVTHDGLLGVPADISHVGWWTGSVRPGSPAGATVIVGHVDSAAEGEGALFHLTDLRSGQHVSISVTAVDGDRRISYRVYARRVYSKSRALPASLFATTGPARLVLITCGGAFDDATRSYLDNIAVWARPVKT